MKKAYIILIHKNPEQVCRLIQKLDDANSTFFVHLDKKAVSEDFEEVFNQGQHVKRVESVSTNWGEYSLVKATLNCLTAVQNSKVPFDRVILLSGQDYPIKSNAEIDTYLSSSPHRVFIEHFSIPNHEKWQPNGGLYRVDKYFRGLLIHQKYTAKALNFLALVSPLFGRKMPAGMEPYAGSGWWVMDMYAVEFILTYILNNPSYANFHRHTFAPDEVFFQMLLLNANDDRLRQSIVSDNLRFIKWKDKRAAHPEVIGREDLSAMMQSKALFARKFDLDKDAEIFDLIDDYCLSEDSLKQYPLAQ